MKRQNRALGIHLGCLPIHPYLGILGRWGGGALQCMLQGWENLLPGFWKAWGCSEEGGEEEPSHRKSWPPGWKGEEALCPEERRRLKTCLMAHCTFSVPERGKRKPLWHFKPAHLLSGREGGDGAASLLIKACGVMSEGHKSTRPLRRRLTGKEACTFSKSSWPAGSNNSFQKAHTTENFSLSALFGWVDIHMVAERREGKRNTCFPWPA